MLDRREVQHLALEIEELAAGLPFGKQVRGLSHSDLGDPAVRAELRELWVQSGLIVFRDVDPNQEFQVESSKVFGELEVYPIAELRDTDNPYVMRSVSDRNTESIYEIDGREAIAWLPWHFDLAWKDKINRGGVLRAIQLSSSGGQTGFIDRIAAYDLLSPELKKEIEGLSVIYRMHADFETSPFAQRVKVLKLGKSQASLQARESEFSPVSHPIVLLHPETGRKALNISPLFAQGIEGDASPSGVALLSKLVDHIHNCPSYFHNWQLDEMLIWDNWRMLHSVSAAPADEVRIVERTTIAGDYGQGRTVSLQN